MRGHGLKFGLLSNSSRNLEEFVAHHGLTADAVLTSGAHGKTKPHESIFLALLERLDVAPAEAVMVGDTLDDDVEGALAVGMRAVLIDRDGRHPEVEGRLEDLSGLAVGPRACVDFGRGPAEPLLARVRPFLRAGGIRVAGRSGRCGGRRAADRRLCVRARRGERTYPYHFHYGMEEWLVVLSGSPTLRVPDGERVLRPGDVVCFPTGPDGGHQVTGPGSVLILSASQVPESIEYPDSGKVGVGPPGKIFRTADATDYWEGE